MTFLDMPYPGPGPQERKWKSRLRFKLFGRWPADVVTERLYLSDLHAARMRAAIERGKKVAGEWNACDPATSIPAEAVKQIVLAALSLTGEPSDD